MIQEGNDDKKDSGLATHSPWYNMHSWRFLPLLPPDFPILLSGIPICGEAHPGSSAQHISDSLWRVSSFHREIEANQMVLAGTHDYCYRHIALGLPCFKLLFWHISLLKGDKGIELNP